MTVEEILSRFDHHHAIAGGWMVRCPCHDDQTDSLSLSEGSDGRVLLHCHAGCSTAAIVAALGVSLTDLFPPREGRSELVTYDYRDEAGALLFQSVRFPSTAAGKKDFRQRRPDGAGGWIWKLDDVRRVLYRLDKLRGKQAVFIVEGEKDADRLWSMGLPATTNSGGAGKWRDDYVDSLQSAGVTRVCVLADNDPPGEAHARQVARSCHDAGLFVRLVCLPGLPAKGDVSDWLDAGHSKRDLTEIVKHAPPFHASVTVAATPKLELTSLADLLAEPEEAIGWLVEDRIPSGSLILVAGKPKAGKSTLTRALAYAVAAGVPWLGYHVASGPVWYLAFEDKRSEVRRHFRMMGATGKEPLWVLVGEAPTDAMALLQARAKAETPALIIVDTLQRLIHAKDMSDYAEVTTKFAPLLKLCRETGATLVVLHHANKYGEGLDCILGSTALSGSVDNIFIVGRGEHHRTLSSIQRIGEDLPATVIEMNLDTGQVKMAGSKLDADTDDAAALILDVLRNAQQPETERWIRDQVQARPKDQARALRMMMRRNWIARGGNGKRGDPYTYAVTDNYRIGGSAGSRGSEQDTFEAQNAPKKASLREPEYLIANTGLSSDVAVSFSGSGAIYKIETGETTEKHLYVPNKNSGGSQNDEEPRLRQKVVPLVPKHIENGANMVVNKSLSPLDATTYSGSRTSDEDEIDDSLFAAQEKP